MKKTLVSITDRQMEILSEEAKAIGISKSELLRRILDKSLVNIKKPIRKDPQIGA